MHSWKIDTMSLLSDNLEMSPIDSNFLFYFTKICYEDGMKKELFIILLSFTLTIVTYTVFASTSTDVPDYPTQDTKSTPSCNEVAPMVLEEDSPEKAFDQNSGGTVAITLTGGSGYYTWSVSGRGFFLDAALSKRVLENTTAQTVTVYVSEEACGKGRLVVDDGCSTKSIFIRSDKGQWVRVDVWQNECKWLFPEATWRYSNSPLPGFWPNCLVGTDGKYWYRGGSDWETDFHCSSGSCVDLEGNVRGIPVPEASECCWTWEGSYYEPGPPAIDQCIGKGGSTNCALKLKNYPPGIDNIYSGGLYLGGEHCSSDSYSTHVMAVTKPGTWEIWEWQCPLEDAKNFGPGSQCANY